MQEPQKLQDCGVLIPAEHYFQAHNSTTLNPEAEQNNTTVTQAPGPQTPQKIKPHAPCSDFGPKGDLNERKIFKSPKSSAKKFTPRIII